MSLALVMKLLRRLRSLFRRNHLDAEMAEELRAHLELQTSENLARGMAVDEARYAAQRSFGGIEQIKERARDQRGWVWLEQLLQDQRFAVRMLRKTPGFTLVAVVSLAIGIGLNTAVFSIINTIFYQTIRGVPEPKRVLIFNDGNASVAGYQMLRDHSRAVAAITAARGTDAVIETSGGDRRGRVLAVAADYFAVLGARAALGRFFLTSGSSDAANYDAPEAVLTHAFWEKHFAGDRAILGRVLRINGTRVTVVGVAASEFHGPGPEGPALWVPLGLAPALTAHRASRPTDKVGLIGRLQPGVTLARAQAEVTVIAARSPEIFGGARFRLSIGREDWQGGESPEKRVEALLVTTVPLVVVGGLLWIACSNVGNLLLARAVQRRKEIAIRVASGASRARLVRMLMAESVLLALMGGAAGLWVSQATLDFVFATLTEFGAISVQLDVRVLLYTTGVCVVAAGLFGVVPAIQASKTDVNGALKGDGGRRTFGGSRLRALLLASQIASSVALLVVAGTFIKTLIGAAYIGEQARWLDHLVLAQLPAPPVSVPRDSFYSALVDQVRALPGTEAVTIVEPTPKLRVVTRPGTVNLEPEAARKIAVQRIDAGYARTAGLTLQRGAWLASAPVDGGLREVLINEAMARTFWPGNDAIGARFDFDGEPGVGVGLVRDGSPSPKAYTSLSIASAVNPALWIRVRGEAGQAVPLVATLLRRHAAEGEFIHVEPLRDVAFRTVSVFARFGAYIGALALSLAAAGVYASMAFSTSQRTREIGVRMALGATPRSVLVLVLHHAVRVIGWGAAVGLVLALIGLRLLFGLLGGGGSGVDLIAIAAVILFFAAIAALACLGPAWRAAKVNPVVALRAE